MKPRRPLFDPAFYRTLVTLALPIAIQFFITSSLNMIDVLMIGLVGEDEVAAVGVANQFFFLYNLLLNGIAGGCSIFFSQYWGAGDREGIHKTIGAGLLSTMGIGLLFTVLALLLAPQISGIFSRDGHVVSLSVDYLLLVCLSYLPTGVTFLLVNAQRSIGNARLPMLISLGAVLVNAGLNYIFIFGKLGAPAMGVRGAALATLIARLIEMAAILALTFRPGSPLRGRLHDFLRPGGAFLRRLSNATLPVVLNEGCWGLASVLYTAAYGIIGTHAIAAAQITANVQNLFLVACFGTANAALVMIGHQIGAGQRQTAEKYAHRFFRLALLLGVLLGVVVVFAAPAILTLFKVTPEARTAAIAMLRIFAAIAPVRVLTVVLIVGVFRGGGDAAFALKAEAMTMWFIGVPLAFLGAAVFHLPVQWVVLLTTLEEVVKGIVCLVHLRRGRWIHDMTQTEPVPAPD